ncbi:MAG: hypothetical protein ABJA37_14740 [Ferruginibacter sp.]
MDEDETYMHGEFSTYEKALQAAKSIVEEHIIYNYKPGMSPTEMSANYTMFGEDPIIISEPQQVESEKFSAWDYAYEFTGKYHKERTKQK